MHIGRDAWRAVGRRLFRRFRAPVLVGLGALAGLAAGVVVTAMSAITNRLHSLLFAIDVHARLSEQRALADPRLALVPAIGGMVLAIVAVVVRARGRRAPVDPIEANALHGGRMSLSDSLILAVQTMISSGFGASVGLEAGYTQVGSGLASRLAVALGLRRAEVRMLVGCGAAGAIAAAFGAPITGAFYGFELIIGTYSVANVAPVMAAALAAELVASRLGAVQTPIEIGVVPAMTATDLLPYLGLGVVGGLAAVGMMQLVAAVERGVARLSTPAVVRPILGGLVVGGFALISPQVLSSGHGALHLELVSDDGLAVLALLFALKVAAAAVSLGTGFRGGLFFTSLFLGSLLGRLFAGALVAFDPSIHVAPLVAAVVGMASMSVGIVGGPMTMTFLVLETSRDLAVGSAVLVASIVSAVVVRETFGYSFSTWRFHLRGETIRSAHDIGWMRSLTVGGMMRADVRTVLADTSVAAFRATFPLGSTQRVVAVDSAGRYVGILIVAEVHAVAVDPATPVADLVVHRDAVLRPSMNVGEAAEIFAATEGEELAVVDDPATGRVVGLLTEQHLLRRYAEELDMARRDLVGGV